MPPHVPYHSNKSVTLLLWDKAVFFFFFRKKDCSEKTRPINPQLSHGSPALPSEKGSRPAGARYASGGPVFLVLPTKRVSYASVLRHKRPPCHPALTPHLLLFCCGFFVAQPWIIGVCDGGHCELSPYCHGRFTVKQYTDNPSTSTRENMIYPL